MIRQRMLRIDVEGSAKLFRQRLDCDVFAEQFGANITKIMHQTSLRSARENSRIRNHSAVLSATVAAAPKKKARRSNPAGTISQSLIIGLLKSLPVG
jgi:hypothetical protein